MPTVDELFRTAVQYHQAGQVPAAESHYRAALQADPNHAAAWENLGILAMQAGQAAAAVEYLQIAVALAPHDALTHFNQGIVYQTAGDADRAADSYRRVATHATARHRSQ